MALFDEASGATAPPLRATDDVCERLGPTHFRVDGREVRLPLEVSDCSILANVFWVSAAAAHRLLGGAPLRIATPLPGRTLLVLLGVQYRDSPLGAYGEAAVLLPVRVPGTRSPLPFGSLLSMLTGSVPQLVYRMPVDQEFTLHAGRFLWGYPKYLARIDVSFEESEARLRLVQHGRLAFSMVAPASSSGRVPEVRGRNLTVRAGRVQSIRASLSGTGVAFRVGGEPPEIGEDDPLAADLRALGLPKTPLVSASIRSARMRFEAPELERGLTGSSDTR